MTPTDANQLEPGLEAIVPEAGQPRVLLLDKGYDQTEPIARVINQHDLLVLCPPRRQPRARLHNEKRRGRAQWKWERRRQMERRFLSPLVRALYRRRQASAEGAFARIK